MMDLTTKKAMISRVGEPITYWHLKTAKCLKNSCLKTYKENSTLSPLIDNNFLNILVLENYLKNIRPLERRGMGTRRREDEKLLSLFTPHQAHIP